MSEILDEIKARSAYALSCDADSGSPDSLESEGALFLTRTRDHLIDNIEYLLGDDKTLAEAVEEILDDSHEIADGAPSIYTHTMWKQFVDLCAYNEDPTELGAEADDMGRCASTCLYIIADRLVHTLLGEIESVLRDEEDDDDEDGDE